MTFFITGISTNVGKTIASGIVAEALEADYWKPIQAGELEDSDSHKIARLVSNGKTKIHANSYALKTPASPHLAAEIDGVNIDLDSLRPPKTRNHLIIEGAGGLLVPVNDSQTIADLIRPEYKVIVVSRHYLGSISHTLLTVEALRNRKLDIAGIIFSGDENESTERIILSKTGAKMIGRIESEPYFDKNVILDYAERFSDNLNQLL